MSSKRRGKEIRAAISRVLSELDAEGVEFSVTGGCHQRVRFMTAEGLRVTYHFSNTPGDVRTLRNTIAGVRRAAALMQ